MSERVRDLPPDFVTILLLGGEDSFDRRDALTTYLRVNYLQDGTYNCVGCCRGPKRYCAVCEDQGKIVIDAGKLIPSYPNESDSK